VLSITLNRFISIQNAPVCKGCGAIVMYFPTGIDICGTCEIAGKEVVMFRNFVEENSFNIQWQS